MCVCVRKRERESVCVCVCERERESTYFLLSQSTVTLYIGMDEVLAHYACTFENSNLHFHFQ